MNERLIAAMKHHNITLEIKNECILFSYQGKQCLFEDEERGYDCVSCDMTDEEYGLIGLQLFFDCPAIWPDGVPSMAREIGLDMDAAKALWEKDRARARSLQQLLGTMYVPLRSLALEEGHKNEQELRGKE